MFDMGFEPQVMKIIGNIRPKQTNHSFLATMPRIMDALAKKTLHSPVEIMLVGEVLLHRRSPRSLKVVDEKEKFHRLLGLLGDLYNKR